MLFSTTLYFVAQPFVDTHTFNDDSHIVNGIATSSYMPRSHIHTQVLRTQYPMPWQEGGATLLARSLTPLHPISRLATGTSAAKPLLFTSKSPLPSWVSVFVSMGHNLSSRAHDSYNELSYFLKNSLQQRYSRSSQLDMGILTAAFPTERKAIA